MLEADLLAVVIYFQVQSFIVKDRERENIKVLFASFKSSNLDVGATAAFAYAWCMYMNRSSM